MSLTLDDPTQAERWAAFARREREADGCFVVAVRSTGIYCPARRPRPENVSFFDTPEAAEAAGYRACLRCRPREVPAYRAVVQRLKAELEPGQLSEFVQPIFEHLCGQLSSLELPLNLRGTAFQLRVWEALRAIPPGQTRTYGELARALGDPKAVRAVARACGANPLPLVVPCHRVIGSDGKLTGYRWGLERKRKLLELEARINSR
ncbi:methylated-DNA--[protein]-cysteine S-methyltransferase [Calidithermus roseus]|uniref:methylated-DNA--[protein]-cysteine S-methyltransferase n=1 Tax=Calidithermus roseus TaxID=1644118 RepID=A0A399ELV5_9DEIN|nr:methylated-DNA--[protein]-cysteine S-methyltransferase [Calidithermus roseus]RIH84039.1 Methylated-DNA--protein-cysteine methyltransferase [Calidithermus roseus]